MSQTAGNVITTGYWSSPDIIPGWVLNHWVGTFVVTELDIDWDVLDYTGIRLPVPVGTRIYGSKFQLYDDLTAPTGLAVKLAGSATDNNSYVLSSGVANAQQIISKGVFRNALATPFSVTTGFTFGLFLHNNNSAPAAGQRAQAAQTTPVNTLYPSAARPKPVRGDVEIWWARPDDGALSSKDITPCPLHERLIAGVQ